MQGRSETKKMLENGECTPERINRRSFIGRLLKISTGAGLLGVFNACVSVYRLPFVTPRENYSSTISVLQELYADELQSRLTYLAYAEQANSEYYGSIAHLFIAFATSDSVHIRNFEDCLRGFGIQRKKPSLQRIQMLSTKENLKRAVELELSQVNYYSQYLEKIKGEKHQVAIEKVWYALESEKKHREHLKRIQQYTGFRFKLLAHYMRVKPVRYFVCQTCGYTVIRPPEKLCPVCNRPVSQYREVERISRTSS